MSYFLSLSDFLHYPFLQHALWATIALAIIAGTLSPIIVSKRYSFMGAAVSHSTLLGLSISLTLFSTASAAMHFIITLLITLLFALILAWKSLQKDLPADSLIGIFFSIMMALGIIVYSLGNGEQSNLLSFLFGNILLLSTFDVTLLITIALISTSIILLNINSWVYFLFDPLGAQLRGIKIKRYHYLLFILMTIVIITSIKLAGTVLVTTLLIIPGVFALQSTTGIISVFSFSIIFSIITSILGLTMANWLNIPSGATLALTQFLCLLLLRAIKYFHN